jgi:hypothetical protein
MPGDSALTGDVGDLHEPELHVLLGRALGPEHERLADRPRRRVGGVRRPHRGERLSGEREGPDVELHADRHGAGAAAVPDPPEGRRVDGLQVAGLGGPHDRRRVGGGRRRPGPGRRVGTTDALREERLDLGERAPRLAVQEHRRLDRLRRVVDEHDQRPDAHQQQHERDGHAHLRHERLGPARRRVDRAEDEERVGERADEDAEHHLVHPVRHEAAQEAGGELAAGELQRDDGHGEHRAGDRDEAPAMAVRTPRAPSAPPPKSQTHAKRLSARGVGTWTASTARPAAASTARLGMNHRLSRTFVQARPRREDRVLGTWWPTGYERRRRRPGQARPARAGSHPARRRQRARDRTAPGRDAAMEGASRAGAVQRSFPAPRSARRP